MRKPLKKKEDRKPPPKEGEYPKYYCTLCGCESPIRFSAFKSPTEQIVGDDEDLCSKCFEQKTGITF